MKNQITTIVSKLLKSNNISFDKDELDFQIQSHPSFPSLHSITGVLNHFNIDNIAAEVPKIVKTLKELPKVFIAQIKDDSGLSLVTIEKNEDNCLVYDGKNKKQKLSSKEFIAKFTGIIVAVEKSENFHFNDNSKKFIRNTFFGTSIISLLTLMYFIGPPFENIIYNWSYHQYSNIKTRIWNRNCYWKCFLFW